MICKVAPEAARVLLPFHLPSLAVQLRLPSRPRLRRRYQSWFSQVINPLPCKSPQHPADQRRSGLLVAAARQHCQAAEGLLVLVVWAGRIALMLTWPSSGRAMCRVRLPNTSNRTIQIMPKLANDLQVIVSARRLEGEALSAWGGTVLTLVLLVIQEEINERLLPPMPSGSGHLRPLLVAPDNVRPHPSLLQESRISKVSSMP